MLEVAGKDICLKLVVQKVQYDERIFAEILVIVTSLSQNSVRKTSQLTSTDEAKYLNLDSFADRWCKLWTL